MEAINEASKNVAKAKQIVLSFLENPEDREILKDIVVLLDKTIEALIEKR